MDETDISTIRYFKNNLILEGLLDISAPEKIDFSQNPLLND
jgi:hypothetical protein